MQLKGFKVLLIDDTIMILQRLGALLSDLEQVAHIESATSAEEALIVMDDYRPDILVLDINMPGMGGIEMLRKMQDIQINKPVIIMLTNNTFAGYRDECMRLGADYFLDKSRDFLMIPTIVQKLAERNILQY
jgi:DNA-binding NarL/FixJ family response regulator